MGKDTHSEGNDRPNCILSATTNGPPAHLDSTDSNPALRRLPTPCQEHADVLRLIGSDLHVHQATTRGLKHPQLAQNRDLQLTLGKLMKNESLNNVVIPEDVQDFAKRC